MKKPHRVYLSKQTEMLGKDKMKEEYNMDAWQVAMKMERDGEKFYRGLAEKAVNPGLREIVNQLASDEAKHYEVFCNMQQSPGEYEKTALSTTDGNIFKQIIVKNTFDHLDTSQLELYQKAMESEQQSQEFYLAEATRTQDPNQRNIYQRIAAEEEQHYFLLHNIYELMLRPQTWVENGEFVHLDEY